MIDLSLSETELRAVLALLDPYVSRHPGDATIASAEYKLDLALLEHEERNTHRPLPDDVQAFADVHEDGQTRLGIAGDQLAVLPLPTPEGGPA